MASEAFRFERGSCHQAESTFIPIRLSLSGPSIGSIRRWQMPPGSLLVASAKGTSCLVVREVTQYPADSTNLLTFGCAIQAACRAQNLCRRDRFAIFLGTALLAKKTVFPHVSARLIGPGRGPPIGDFSSSVWNSPQASGSLFRAP